MAKQTLQPIIQAEGKGHLILSPAVGSYSHRPQPGILLSSGSFIGSLKILRRNYDLYMPENLEGRVIAGPEHDYTLPVEYRQELFGIEPAIENTAAGKAVAQANQTEEPLEEGFVLSAFTNGIFYAAPSPDAPPFAGVGQKIHKGKTLGLIEVMKTFNYIIFHGTDVSANGEIKRIYVKDSQEVKQGQPLFLIGDK